MNANSQSTAAQMETPQPAEHHWRGYLYIAIATFLWGAAGVVARALFEGRMLPAALARNMTPLVLSETRTSISFLLLAPFFALFRRNTAAKPSKRQLVACLLLGCMGAGSNFFYYFSVQKTSVAIGILLQYLAPVWVLGYLVARRLQQPTAARVLGVVLAVAGCGLAVGIDPQRTHLAILGIAAGLGASFCYAGYNVLGRTMVQKLGHSSVFFLSLCGTALLWFAVNPWWRLLNAGYSGAQWVFLLGFAVCSVLIPYAFFFSGLRHLDATRAIVTGCLEPVFAIALAWLLLGDAVTPLQIGGIVAVLAGTIVVQR